MEKFKELIRDIEEARNKLDKITQELDKIKYEDFDRLSSIIYTRLFNFSKILNEKRDKILRIKNILNLNNDSITNDNIIIKDKEKYHIITYKDAKKTYEALIFKGDEYTEDFYLPDPPIDANETDKVLSLLHLNKGDITVESKIANKLYEIEVNAGMSKLESMKLESMKYEMRLIDLLMKEYRELEREEKALKKYLVKETYKLLDIAIEYGLDKYPIDLFWYKTNFTRNGEEYTYDEVSFYKGKLINRFREELTEYEKHEFEERIDLENFQTLVNNLYDVFCNNYEEFVFEDMLDKARLSSLATYLSGDNEKNKFIKQTAFFLDETLYGVKKYLFIATNHDFKKIYEAEIYTNNNDEILHIHVDSDLDDYNRLRVLQNINITENKLLKFLVDEEMSIIKENYEEMESELINEEEIEDKLENETENVKININQDKVDNDNDLDNR